jgi:inner membrane protein
MQNNSQDFNENKPVESPTQSNRILVKGIITGALILIMLIPTIFITNLVQEREERQKQVVSEVSNKWAKPQTVTGPYLLLPYNETAINGDGKYVNSQRYVVLLPENLNLIGDIAAEQRPRSIYKVLLYKSNITGKGSFSIKLPAGIVAEKLLVEQAKLCIGITDFKGIEGPVSVTFNGANYDLTAGLPATVIDTNGLSSPISLTLDDLRKDLAFSLNLTLKGSEQLSFIPLSGNSSYTLHSVWPNPSFSGNTLPGDRAVSEKGFTASWRFNKANLPFSTFFKDFNISKESYSFGVSMLQPADQYAKTMRSVKYAILFIGLTFSLFFIVELLQKKPLHPVQYILVGLALVIFYTLLLSISEFILFDYAYLIAATATVLLITLYAKGHFLGWKVAFVFGAVLGALYAFIFVLIRLEDTALLVGSIGLFAVIALVMYASRKINWYNPSFAVNNTKQF